MELKDKTRNQINILHIFKEGGIWMFNDEEVGLYKEPFVGNMNSIIDGFIKDDKCTIFISHSFMPGYSGILNLLPPKEIDGLKIHGYYQLEGTESVGWLCPAMLRYFNDYPKKVYFKIQK